MDLSIIIVSWNVRDKLRENLAALYDSRFSSSREIPPAPFIKGEPINFEVFVVDNNSVDGTVEVVKNEFPQVKLIANQENFGFAKANNQAIKQASGEFVLLLNPDMKVFPDTLNNMIVWMKNNPQANVAGCNLVDESGKNVKHVRRFPLFKDQLAVVLKLPHIFPLILGKYLREDFDYTKAAKVDSVRGGFFMIRKTTIDTVGMLDERFFVWFEEVDYCKRVYEADGEVWYTPDAECIDYVGQSFKQVKRGVTQKYFRDSMLKYFQKWHPFWQCWTLKLAWPIGIFLTWLGGKLNFKSEAKT